MLGDYLGLKGINIETNWLLEDLLLSDQLLSFFRWRTQLRMAPWQGPLTFASADILTILGKITFSISRTPVGGIDLVWLD